MPKDPVMLLSYVNLKLRDFYTNLDQLCEELDAERLSKSWQVLIIIMMRRKISLSEKIKIAIVIDDEKSNADKKDGVAPSLILTQDASVTLMPVLLKNHLMTGSFCGQRGDCGRCIVQFTEGAPLPTGLERDIGWPA